MKNNKPLVQCIHVEYCSDPHCYHYHPHKRDFKNLGCGRVRKCRQGRAISCWVVKDNTRLNELKNLIHKVRSKHFRLKMEYEDSIVIRLQEQIDQEEINLGINQKDKCPKDCNVCEFSSCPEKVTCLAPFDCNICKYKVCKLHNI